MKCKKHPTDLSSTVGVCASCLRHRLTAIAAAENDHRKLETQKQQWSVSPYIFHRKSTASAVAWKHNQLFFCTPQLRQTGSAAMEMKKNNWKINGGTICSSISSLFWGIFRSKSTESDTHPVHEPDLVTPSWYSAVIPNRRKKQTRTFSIDESIIGKPCHRGMSPDCGGLSGYSSESSEKLKQTPRRTPSTAVVRRGMSRNHSRSLSGFGFCLSPLVRASPNLQWKQKGITPEMVVVGESRVPVKPHLTTVASFSKNRSRKLVDLGRYNY